MRGSRYYYWISKVMIFVIDFWLIRLAFVATSNWGTPSDLSEDQYTSFFLIFGLTWVIAGFFNKIYRIDNSSLMRNVSIGLVGTFIVHFIIIGILLIGFHLYNIKIEFLACVYLFTAALVVAFRLAYKLALKYYQFSGFDKRKVVVIGATASGLALANYFSKHENAGYDFKGFFDDAPYDTAPFKDQLVGRLQINGIKEFCSIEEVGEIYFALPLTHTELLQEISKYADDNFIYLRLVPDFSKVVPENNSVFLLNSIPVLATRKDPLGISFNANIKRAFDFVFSLTVILGLFSFIFPIIAIAIRLDSPGPIFFKQVRPGKRNKLFDCYKFRTMYSNNRTEVQATRNDSRITRVGRILRKTNLDELPQFFNVLLGNMSVVGPRPNMVSQLEEYSKTIAHYRVRHFVTPGITGYAQVNGFRGETKEVGLMEKRVQFDVEYIENWSLELDIKIIFQTVWNMVKGEKNAF